MSYMRAKEKEKKSKGGVMVVNKTLHLRIRIGIACTVQYSACSRDSTNQRAATATQLGLTAVRL